MKIIKYTTLLLTLFLMVTGVKAQQNSGSGVPKDNIVKDTVALSKMAIDLGLDKLKERQINTIMNYRQDELARIMQDPAIDRRQKMAALTNIETLRRNKLDSALTPAQQIMMAKQRLAIMKKNEAVRNAVIQHHREEMSPRVPIKSPVKIKTQKH